MPKNKKWALQPNMIIVSIEESCASPHVRHWPFSDRNDWERAVQETPSNTRKTGSNNSWNLHAIHWTIGSSKIWMLLKLSCIIYASGLKTDLYCKIQYCFVQLNSGNVKYNFLYLQGLICREWQGDFKTLGNKDSMEAANWIDRLGHRSTERVLIY